jgi:predicted nucleic acid-binding protein
LTLLDTSVVIRYITGDPFEQAKSAGRLIESSEALTLTDVVLAESAFVLSSNYGHGRGDVVDALAALVGRANVRASPIAKDSVLAALALCRPSGRLSIPDAMTWATAKHQGLAVATFDRRFPGDGIEVLHLG